MHDPRLTGNTCFCVKCETYFNSPTAFDHHRTGKPDKRRCLTPAELAVCGSELDDKGRWTPPRRPLAA